MKTVNVLEPTCTPLGVLFLKWDVFKYWRSLLSWGSRKQQSHWLAKSWSEVKIAVCFLPFKGGIRRAYTGGTPCIKSDFMIWEAVFSYFKHFYELSNVPVTNIVAHLINKDRIWRGNSLEKTHLKLLNVRTLRFIRTAASYSYCMTLYCVSDLSMCRRTQKMKY